ncbi:MAG: ATP-binding protein [Desulfobacterales bacterium]|jgi:two-component system NtrC family sensor kinase
MPDESTGYYPKKLPLNIAIVGGGRACKFFLQLLKSESFPYLNINLVGVCDIKPDAEGLLMAKQMGIYTTDNFKDLFNIKDLDGIIELTNSQEVLLELIKLRPKTVGIVEHNIGKILRYLFLIDQQLKSAKQQVTDEKMISEFLIQQTNEPIVVLNTDFTILEANEAYLKQTNKTREEAIGAYCYKIFYDFDAPCLIHKPEHECPMIKTLRTGESAHVIIDAPVSSSQSGYFEIVTYPVKNTEGEVGRIIEIHRDITKELSSRWEEKVQKLKQDLNHLIQEDRMISLGKLVASCVHEINNPIQGLLTFSRIMEDILVKGQPTSKELEEFKEYLSLMSPELERCGNIVSGLLSFSRETALEYKNLNLNEVLEAVIALIRHKLELQGIKLTLHFYPEMLWVRGNANRLEQCLLNLIFNAMEAMPEGGELHVVSGFDHTEKKVLVEIRDSGSGIHQDDMQHIFDPFFTTKEAGKGTGLGLSIVYGIVKNHDGHIRVESEVGKGSSFFLEFPYRYPSGGGMEENHGH